MLLFLTVDTFTWGSYTIANDALLLEIARETEFRAY